MTRHRLILFSSFPRSAALLATALAASLLSGPLGAQSLELLSVDTQGDQGTLSSSFPSLSASGHLVAFRSRNSFVSSDGNSIIPDVYLRDTRTGVTTLVSKNPQGRAGNDWSHSPHISSRGDAVTFASAASDLVANDINGYSDIFLSARSTMVLVSVGSGGVQANGDSGHPGTNSTGEFIVFESDATNLDFVPDTNGGSDIFLRDVRSGTTTCLSLNFGSSATANGASFDPVISDDGQSIVFASDASNLTNSDFNTHRDIFLYTPATGVTKVSQSRFGVAGNSVSFFPKISRNGRFILFTSYSNNLVPGTTNFSGAAFLLDRNTGDVTIESVATGGGLLSALAAGRAVSDDGRYVLFDSKAPELPNGGTPESQLYIRDRHQNITYPVSTAPGGGAANGEVEWADLASQNLVIGFACGASNLVSPDINGTVPDVFVREPAIARWLNYGTGHPGTLGVPKLELSVDPVIGKETDILIERSSPASSSAFVLIGTDSDDLPTNWDGTILVDFLSILILPLPDPVLSYTLLLGQDPALEGADVYLQLIELDSGASDGFAFSRGLRMSTGY